MAGGNDRQGIFGVRLPDSTAGLWFADGHGYLFVAVYRAIGHLTKGLPDLELKGCAYLIKGKGKVLALPVEVLEKLAPDLVEVTSVIL